MHRIPTTSLKRGLFATVWPLSTSRSVRDICSLVLALDVSCCLLFRQHYPMSMSSFPSTQRLFHDCSDTAERSYSSFSSIERRTTALVETRDGSEGSRLQP
ncbi:hypothetical protein JAAARDRAFT_288956, partial [Jaapia argillacea MUCL 33604]